MPSKAAKRRPRRPSTKKSVASAAKPARMSSGLAPEMQAVNTYLAVANVNASIEFLERAFGFTRGVVLPGSRRPAALRGDAPRRFGRDADSERATARRATGGAAALYTYVGDVDKALTQGARGRRRRVAKPKIVRGATATATVTDPDGYAGCWRRSRSWCRSLSRSLAVDSIRTDQHGSIAASYIGTICSAQNSLRTRAQAACGNRACCRGSVSSITPLSAISSSASGGCRKPLTPCSITSGRPPTRDATTGTSHAIASSAARPKLSCADGSRNRSRSTAAAPLPPARPASGRAARCRARARAVGRRRARAVADQQQPRRHLAGGCDRRWPPPRRSASPAGSSRRASRSSRRRRRRRIASADRRRCCRR